MGSACVGRGIQVEAQPFLFYSSDDISWRRGELGGSTEIYKACGRVENYSTQYRIAMHGDPVSAVTAGASGAGIWQNIACWCGGSSDHL